MEERRDGVTSALLDVRGEPVTAATRESVRQLDGAIEAYLGARADTRARLDAALAADPQCALGHCLDGYLFMLSSKREGIQRARASVASAQAAAAHARVSRRERGHLAALDAWSRGEMRDAVRHWDAILADHPRDIVALKVSQFVLSYLGESQRMRETVERVLPAWSAGVAGYGYVLGCHAYALEEAGDYSRAEETGRRAVELNPADIWAAHAVAHVREMEGRLHDGIEWITTLAAQWRECSNFALHLRWHEALYRIELEEYDRVLDLYDREVRPESTDEYLDVANAASLLWRLEQAEVDVGTRWRELAERASTRIDDHALVFVDLHYLMALAAADEAAVDRCLDSCAVFAKAASGTESAVMAEVGLSLARAVVAHRRRHYSDVVDELMPVRTSIRRIGGSHAQRDVFEQLLIDAALRSRPEVAADLLSERTTLRPGNIWGWKHRAAVLEALRASEAVSARRELERLRGEPR